MICDDHSYPSVGFHGNLRGIYGKLMAFYGNFMGFNHLVGGDWNMFFFLCVCVFFHILGITQLTDIFQRG